MTDEEWIKKLNGYFIGACRKWLRWSPIYREALKKATVKRDKHGEWYKCNACSSEVRRSEKHVDHILPVVPTNKSFDYFDWNTYRDRMGLRTPVPLQILCRVCHKKKTKKENEERRRWKKKAA